MINRNLTQIVFNEPSWCFGTASTRVAVTRLGGMMAPVYFFADSGQPVQPYYINPWWNEGCDADVIPLLQIVRGDFFCAPFGGNSEALDGVEYPPHGHTASAPWELEMVRQTKAGAALIARQAQPAGGVVRKSLAVVEGQSVVYSRHDLSGMEGPMCIGHHPNHFVPDSAGAGYLSFAPHRFAHTYIKPTENPEEKGYSMLKPDAPIADLRACPTITGQTTDLTRYPSRRGYEDIVMLSAQEGLELGWSAFSVPSMGYAWFSLKDPKVLASTLLWMSNGGRHFPPWSGRNVNCLGIEEITGFFHEGRASSAKKNFVSDQGIPTSVMLKREETLSVNFIQGVVRIPPEFTRVFSIEKNGEGKIVLVSEEGIRVEADVDLSFIASGSLKDLIE